MTKLLFLLVACACFFSGSAAWASLIVSVQPLPVAAAPGDTGDSFDVLLTNTGPNSVDIGGFSFGVTTANTAIDFTGAFTNTALAPYIFAGHSLFGPEIDTTSGAQEVIASDLYDISGSGATLGTGAVVGLGHVTFDVASNAAPGPFDLTLEAYPTTSLSDQNGNNVTINTLTNGAGVIAIPGSGVPEPSTWLLLASGLLAIALLRRRRLA